MISKEEAEEKLLKIYYDSKLDNCFKKNPTKAEKEAYRILRRFIKARNGGKGTGYILRRQITFCNKYIVDSLIS